MVLRISVVVAFLMLAASCASAEPVTSTTVRRANDYVHNGENVTEVARIATWGADIRGAGSVLSNEDTYRYVIEWANASSEGAQLLLDGEKVASVCWGQMGAFQDDLLGYHLASDEIDLTSTAVGLGIAVGAETTVTPKSQQQRFLSACIDEFEAFFVEVHSSGAYNRCDEYSELMRDATTDEAYAAWEILYVDCIGLG